MRVKVGQIRFLGSKPGIMQLAIGPCGKRGLERLDLSFLSNAGRDHGLGSGRIRPGFGR